MGQTTSKPSHENGPSSSKNGTSSSSSDTPSRPFSHPCLKGKGSSESSSTTTKEIPSYLRLSGSSLPTSSSEYDNLLKWYRCTCGKGCKRRRKEVEEEESVGRGQTQIQLKRSRSRKGLDPSYPSFQATTPVAASSSSSSSFFPSAISLASFGSSVSSALLSSLGFGSSSSSSSSAIPDGEVDLKASSTTLTSLTGPSPIPHPSSTPSAEVSARLAPVFEEEEEIEEEVEEKQKEEEPFEEAEDFEEIPDEGEPNRVKHSLKRLPGKDEEQAGEVEEDEEEGIEDELKTALQTKPNLKPKDDDRCECHERFLDNVLELVSSYGQPLAGLCILVDAFKRRPGDCVASETTSSSASSSSTSDSSTVSPWGKRRKDVAVAMCKLLGVIAREESNCKGVPPLQSLVLQKFCVELVACLRAQPRVFLRNFVSPTPDLLPGIITELAVQLILRDTTSSNDAFELAILLHDQKVQRASIQFAIYYLESVIQLEEFNSQNVLTRLGCCLRWGAAYNDITLTNQLTLLCLKATKGCSFSRWQCSQSIIRYDKQTTIKMMLCCVSLITPPDDSYFRSLLLDVSPAILTGIAEWYLSIPSELRLQIKGRFVLSFAFAFAKYLGELGLYSSAASVAWALLQSCPNETDATQDFLSPTVTRFYLEMLSNFDKERLDSTLKSIIDSRGMHSSLSQAHAFASERGYESLFSHLEDRTPNSTRRFVDPLPPYRIQCAVTRRVPPMRVSCRIVLVEPQDPNFQTLEEIE